MTEHILQFVCEHLPACVLVLSVLDILAFGYVSAGIRKLSRKGTV